MRKVTETRAVTIALVTLGLSCTTTDNTDQTETIRGAITSAAETVGFVFTVPFPLTQDQVAVGAGASLAVDDRAQITSGTAAANVTNSGSTGTRIGTDLSLASVLTVASATVAPRATVARLVTSGTAQIDPAAHVASVTQQANLGPFRTYSYTGHFNPCTTDVIVQPGGRSAIAPGSYCSVTVNAGGSLQLTGGGSYFFQNLDIEPHAALALTASSAPSKLFVRTNLLWKGTIRSTSGPAPSVLVSYASTNAVSIDGPLTGTLVAPNAAVTLNDQNDVHAGAVFARSVEVQAGVRLHQVAFPIGSAGLDLVDPATVIAGRAALATALADPKLPTLLTGLTASFANQLTPYQRQLVSLLLFINQNASLLKDPSQLTASELARLPSFNATILGSPVIQAINGAGQSLLNDPAALSAAISSFAAASGSPPPTIPPAPAESCGGVQPTVRTALNNLAADPAVASLRTNIGSLAHSSNFAGFLGPASAATLLSPTALANLTLPGSPGVPIFSLLNVVKGAVEVAAGAVAIVGAVVADGPGLVVGLAIGAGTLSAIAGGIDLYEGITENDNTCPGTAPTCKADADCGGNICSYGCCVVRSTASALISSGVVACATNADCTGASFCGNGCCQGIIIP